MKISIGNTGQKTLSSEKLNGFDLINSHLYEILVAAGRR